MKRSKWEGATRVYEYGCRPAGPVPEAALHQLWLMDDMWNGCVQVEARARAAAREVLAGVPGVAALQERLSAATAARDEARAAIKATNRGARSAREPAKEVRERIAGLQGEIRSLAGAIKEAKASGRAIADPALEAVERQRQARVKEMRQWYAARGLYWCNSNAILDDYNVARVRAMKEGADLRPHRHTGEGRWRVQLQTEQGQPHFTVADLFGEGRRTPTQVACDPVDWSGFGGPAAAPHGERRRRARTGARIRVCSQDRDPVWLELHATLHRPLPEGMPIVAAEVWRRRAPQDRWTYGLCFTVRVPQPEGASPALPATALDLRWRRLPTGNLRAGFAVSDDGWECEIATPTRRQRRDRRTPDGTVVERIAPADRAVFTALAGQEEISDLASLRDRHFDACRAMLVAWIAAAPNVPDWLAEEAGTLAQWRSKGRLRRLAQRWRIARFSGDQVPVAALGAWLERDAHLADYADGTRAAWQRVRREAYRRAAVDIARRSSILVLEAMDLRVFGRTRAPEEADPAERHRHVLQRTAAPSVLRGAVVNACRARGVRIIEVPATDTTRRHHACGEIVPADYAGEIRVRCERCGLDYDQSANACRNLLALAASEAAAP